MTDDALPLELSAPRRARARAGAARSALEKTLRAWGDVGHLVGAGAAAARRVLRDSADAVDAAHGALEPPRCRACGAIVPDAYSGSPGGLAYANNIHAALLAAATPTTDGGPDPYAGGTDDDDLAAAVAAALAGTPAPAPGDPSADHGD
jgi:hypothetical protein